MEAERVKEKRLLRVYGADVDPISFYYNKKKSKDGRKYGLKSEMSIDDVKVTIGSTKDWLGLILPAIQLKLYIQQNEGDKEENFIGPLPVLDKIGKYLDGNQYTLVVRVVPVSFST